jgi:alpha-galactosidase
MLGTVGNIASRKVPFDVWLIDAGWFSCGTNWARYVGNLDPDPARFPNGLKPVADAAHSAGMKFLLWFEPERVMPGTWLHAHHPEWLLRPTDSMPPELRYQVADGFHLFDLGNPQALAWLEAKLSGMVRDVGIDVFRNDFNIYPLYLLDERGVCRPPGHEGDALRHRLVSPVRHPPSRTPRRAPGQLR